MFNRANLAIVAGAGENQVFAYKTDDTSFDIRQDGYFDSAYDVMTKGAFILADTKYGSLVMYVAGVNVDGKSVAVSTNTRPTLEGAVANNNSITVAEIDATLASYNIQTPLSQRAGSGDRTFLCKYDENIDQWYFEKMNPCPATSADVNALSADSLQTLVQHGNKIKRAEIEACITDAGYALPSGNYNFTLYINDIGRVDNMYLCRYDTVQDEWYQELLKKA